MATLDLWKCTMCGYLSPNLKHRISHLRLVHGKDENFLAVCHIGECVRQFVSFAGFSTHVYRYHRRTIGLECGQDDLPENGDDSDDEDDPITDVEVVLPVVNPVCEENAADPMGMEFCHQDSKKSTAKFLLNLAEGLSVSEVALTEMIAGCRTQCLNVAGRLHEMYKKILVDNGVNCDEVLDQCSIEDPFDGLHSSYLRNKYYKENFNYLEAKEISFGKPYYVERFHGSKRQKVLKVDKFYYVPLLKLLEMLLKQKEIANEVFCPHKASDGMVADICDGAVYATHPMFSVNPHALQIIAYYDELEVCNTVGTYVRKHKLGCLFFTLGNIRPQYRSTFKSIFVLAIGKYEDICKYGIDAFLTLFVEDLKTLYVDGICFFDKSVHGALLAFLADNLAAHFVAGFKQSFSFALRICRTCMVTPDLTQTCVNEQMCHLRTPEEHEQQCLLLDNPIGSHHSVNFGINRRSILEDVPGFSVVTGLPHDIMHDLLEGVVPYELKLFLTHCVTEQYFSINELNQRMDRFDFLNKQPSPIDAKVCKPAFGAVVRQSASQMLSLIMELPFLIADKIPETDEYWQSMIILIKICKLALAPSCSHDAVPILALLVEEKLTTFKKLYPQARIIPKQHFMVHYPSQIALYGPLVRSWCMRNEAKLSFVKRAAKRSNFKNVCMTTINRHQLWLCNQLESKNFLIPDVNVSPKVTETPLAHEPEHIRLELVKAVPELSPTSIVCHCKWVLVSSTEFKKERFFLLHYDEMDPNFARVVDVITFTDNRSVVLYVQVYVAKYFDYHYQAFVVKPTGIFLYVNVNDLAHFQELSVKYSFSSANKHLYISLPCTY